MYDLGEVDQVRKKIKPNELITTINNEKIYQTIDYIPHGGIVTANVSLYNTYGQFSINADTNAQDYQDLDIEQEEQKISQTKFSIEKLNCRFARRWN